LFAGNVYLLYATLLSEIIAFSKRISGFIIIDQFLFFSDQSGTMVVAGNSRVDFSGTACRQSFLSACMVGGELPQTMDSAAGAGFEHTGLSAVVWHEQYQRGIRDE